jgi:hypothetical protein
VGEGYVETFAELMEGTDWEQYRLGKSRNAPTAHCGFEGTAAREGIVRPPDLHARPP